MTDIRGAIKDAIEQKLGDGDWIGITVDDGRYEGNLDSVDIDRETIEVLSVDLDSLTITVTASGLGSTTHKDADGEDISGELDVDITAKVAIDIGKALKVDASEAA